MNTKDIEFTPNPIVVTNSIEEKKLLLKENLLKEVQQNKLKMDEVQEVLNTLNDYLEHDDLFVVSHPIFPYNGHELATTSQQLKHFLNTLKENKVKNNKTFFIYSATKYLDFDYIVKYLLIDNILDTKEIKRLKEEIYKLENFLNSFNSVRSYIKLGNIEQDEMKASAYKQLNTFYDEIRKMRYDYQK